MPARSASRSSLGRATAVLSVVLLAEGALFYTSRLAERTPVPRPLAEFPSQVHDWQSEREEPVDESTRNVLRADAILNRVYASPSRRSGANLFVAYFRTQKAGQVVHSPKNCLPGNGYEPEEQGFLTLKVPGVAAPLEINRDVVARGDDRRVVLYWYQTHDRAIASEYRAKFRLVVDSFRYHRSDTALVRVVVPAPGEDSQAATRAGIDFIRDVYPLLRAYLPS